MTGDDDILAAEYALGLLDPTECVTVQTRARADAALSLRITWWGDRFAALTGEFTTEPPAHLWPQIAARLPANDNVGAAMKRWRAVAITAMAVAAALLVVIGMRPEPMAPVPTRSAPMIAALVGDQGAVVAVSYEAVSGRMMVAPDVLNRGRGDVELWVIPAGKTVAVSLGVIDARVAQAHSVDAPKRVWLQPGATFAISQEPKGGSPSGAPTGPIVASGKIIRT